MWFDAHARFLNAVAAATDLIRNTHIFIAVYRRFFRADLPASVLRSVVVVLAILLGSRAIGRPVGCRAASTAPIC